MNTEVPSLLADVLAAPPTPQRAFPWKPAGWRTEMHDLPDVLTMLEGLPDRVDRTTIRDTVLAELESGRVVPAFVAAMVWGYGDAGYGARECAGCLQG